MWHKNISTEKILFSRNKVCIMMEILGYITTMMRLVIPINSTVKSKFV